jgi:hypothetical protein
MYTRIDEIADRIYRISLYNPMVAPTGRSDLQCVPDCGRWSCDFPGGPVQFSSLNPSTGRTIRQLATLAPRMLALMHGPAFAGDCTAALHALATDYDRRIRSLLDSA